MDAYSLVGETVINQRIAEVKVQLQWREVLHESRVSNGKKRPGE